MTTTIKTTIKELGKTSDGFNFDSKELPVDIYMHKNAESVVVDIKGDIYCIEEVRKLLGMMEYIQDLD
jgi:hypothetical protein